MLFKEPRIDQWVFQRERYPIPLITLDEPYRKIVRAYFGLPEGVDQYIYPIQGTPTINLVGLRVLLHRRYLVRELRFTRLPIVDCLSMGCVYLEARQDGGKRVIVKELPAKTDMFYSFQVDISISPRNRPEVVERYTAEGDACPHNCTEVTRRSLLRFAQSRALAFVLRQFLTYGVTLEELDTYSPVSRDSLGDHQKGMKEEDKETPAKIKQAPTTQITHESKGSEDAIQTSEQGDDVRHAAEVVTLVRSIKQELNRFPDIERATALSRASFVTIKNKSYQMKESELLEKGTKNIKWLKNTLERLKKLESASGQAEATRNRSAEQPSGANATQASKAPPTRPATDQMDEMESPESIIGEPLSKWDQEIEQLAGLLDAEDVRFIVESVGLNSIKNDKTKAQQFHLLSKLRAKTREAANASRVNH